MNKQNKAAKAIEVARRLEDIITSPACALEYDSIPWKLMVMSRLSAQCTDERVNIVCRDLFAHFPTLEDMAHAEAQQIEDIIRPCGLFRTKAVSIRDACHILLYQYNGIVPSDIETLVTFPGIGRKTANLIVGEIYNMPAVVADTHCMRVTTRLGLCSKADPLLVEQTLKDLLPSQMQFLFSHRTVLFGRHMCKARAPLCHTQPCPLADLCQYYFNERRTKS